MTNRSFAQMICERIWNPVAVRLSATVVACNAPCQTYASVSDIARAEKIDRSYAGCILRLTLLAPEIVEAIMDGRQPAEFGAHVLREGFPMEWREQREQWLLGRSRASGIA